MEISQIQNWDEIDKALDKTLEQLINITNDTETDLYAYFESIKTLNNDIITCPKCGLILEPIEVGLIPQKTLEDWQLETKGEENAMDFENIRSYIRVMMKSELIHAVLSIRSKPTNVDAQVLQLKKSVIALQNIAEIITDVSPASKQAQNKDELIVILIEALEDIRKSIVATTK